MPAELENVDGDALLQKAAALAPESRAEIELASASMSREPLATKHLESAASLAADGSLLAENLAKRGAR